MERRAQPRASVEERVWVTLLSAESAAQDIEFEALLVNVSQQGMRLVTDRAIPVSHPVRILTAQRLVLGEAMYCLADGPSRYVAGIAVEQVLSELPEIQRMANSIWREQPERAQRERRAVS